jgi:hypothetical protein
MQTDGWTEKAKLTGEFLQFSVANAPETINVSVSRT